MVYRAKYTGAPTEGDLGRALARVVARHPLYAGADLLVAVPGHKTGAVSYSQRLAAVVAAERGLMTCAPTCRHEHRPESKAGEVYFDVEGEFSFHEHEVRGRVLLVVDDVYRSGRTMSAIAGAAKKAGARAVVGLVGARTMRAR
jgi:predicted amidophosphoribosyltransferase